MPQLQLEHVNTLLYGNDTDTPAPNVPIREQTRLPACRLKEDQVHKLQQLQSEHALLQQELALKRNEAIQVPDLKQRVAAAEAR